MRTLRIEANPFSFTDVLDVKIEKEINTYGNAWVKGIIAEDREETYVKMAQLELQVEIVALDFQGTRRTIFFGILENMHIDCVNGLKVMELSVMSQSRLLDINPHIKVFQNENLTYNELVSATLSPFGDARAILHCGDEQAIGEMFVQYQETAWAFLKRMAGNWGDVVVPDDTRQGIRHGFGFYEKPDSDALPAEPISYQIEKDVLGYLTISSTQSVSENDFVYYVVKDREIRELGEPVALNGQTLFVTKIQSLMEGRELVHLYTMHRRGGIRVKPYRNFTIIGASLSGQVVAIDGTHVQMKLDTAHSNDKDTIKWHPFSTVYSTPDSTGWYAMPEIGDTLRLYFPTEIEGDGYTISAVHTYGPSAPGSDLMKNANIIGKRKREIGDAASQTSPESSSLAGQPAGSSATARDEYSSQMNPEKPDPNYKYIANVHGKWIALCPDSISIGSKDGGIIEIRDGKGITISSLVDIVLRCDRDINIRSHNGDIAIIGNEKVSVSQKNAIIELSQERVTFKGAQIITE